MVAAPVTQEEQDAEAANGMGQGAGSTQQIQSLTHRLHKTKELKHSFSAHYKLALYQI